MAELGHKDRQHWDDRSSMEFCGYWHGQSVMAVMIHTLVFLTTLDLQRSWTSLLVGLFCSVTASRLLHVQ